LIFRTADTICKPYLMSNSLKILYHQGKQYIPDLENAKISSKHSGKPLLLNSTCTDGCKECINICPAEAIQKDPVRLDLGKCVFCTECENVCPAKKITFTTDYHLASNSREALVMDASLSELPLFDPGKIREEIKGYFGKSLKLRLVSAGSCNGCELEMNAAGNVNFDMGRFGIEFTASPRHSDGLVITGPMVENSNFAIKSTFDAIPQPKILILAGACAISGGIFQNSLALQRDFIKNHFVDLYLPGCPPHPLTIVNGILNLIKSRKH